MQPIKIMSWPSRRKRKWNQFSQFSWGSTKEIPIEKILASYILTMSQGFKRNSNCWTSSPTYPFLKLIQHIHLAARSTSPDMTTVFHARRCRRFIAINSNLRRKKPHRKNECPKCLCNSDNKGGPIQFQREKDNRRILKGDFSSRLDLSIVTSIAPQLCIESNEIKWVFPALKSINHFLS